MAERHVLHDAFSPILACSAPLPLFTGMHNTIRNTSRRGGTILPIYDLVNTVLYSSVPRGPGPSSRIISVPQNSSAVQHRFHDAIEPVVGPSRMTLRNRTGHAAAGPAAETNAMVPHSAPKPACQLAPCWAQLAYTIIGGRGPKDSVQEEEDLGKKARAEGQGPEHAPAVGGTGQQASCPAAQIDVSPLCRRRARQVVPSSDPSSEKSLGNPLLLSCFRL